MGEKYKHRDPTSYEEVVSWLTKEAKTCDRLFLMARRLAREDGFHKFLKFFNPKEFSQEELMELSDIELNLRIYCENNKWEWIDAIKDAFLSLGDQANAKKVEEAINAEFGKQ